MPIRRAVSDASTSIDRSITGRTVRLLGIRINPVRLDDLLTAVVDSVERRIRTTIFYVNIHTMNRAQSDPVLAGTLDRADIVYCDGTGVRLGAWLVGKRIPERMTGADWIHDLCRLARKKGLSLFLLGSEEGVAGGAASVLVSQYPGLTVVGTASGYGAGADVIAAINAAAPDILLVGMGTPTQEKWIDDNRDVLDVPVVWAVGALFEFVSGRISRGPRWLTEHGMEWLCRLVVEPRKLWRRYLLGNPHFFWRILRERRHGSRGPTS